MSSSTHPFIVTQEYRRFTEFCDACRQYRYIGLCYGPPGVGKTLSARHYAKWDKVEVYRSYEQSGSAALDEVLGSDTIFYTVPVLNGPGQIERDLDRWRRHLLHICWGAIYREEEIKRNQARKRINEYWDTFLTETDWLSPHAQPPSPAPGDLLREISIEYSQRRDATVNPTSLIVVDEADRLKMASLEQLRALFDGGGIGLILVGMPGLEKRLARYPQLYSRVGFVHEFRCLPAQEVRLLMEQQWKPREVASELCGIRDEEVVASLVRITGGNFRLLHRLLTQIARVMEINSLETVTRQVVETARESLVIGSG